MIEGNPTCWYFGCIGRAGHDFFSSDSTRPEPPPQTWDAGIDRAFNRNPANPARWQPVGPQPEGIAEIEHRDGHTRIGWWDRSGDERHGSHSQFIIEGTLDFDQAIAIAKRWFPIVFSRAKFEIKLGNRWAAR